MRTPQKQQEKLSPRFPWKGGRFTRTYKPASLNFLLLFKHIYCFTVELPLRCTLDSSPSSTKPEVSLMQGYHSGYDCNDPLESKTHACTTESPDNNKSMLVCNRTFDQNCLKIMYKKHCGGIKYILYSL